MFLARELTGSQRKRETLDSDPYRETIGGDSCVERLEAEASLKAKGKIPQRIHHTILPSRTSCPQNGKDICVLRGSPVLTSLAVKLTSIGVTAQSVDISFRTHIQSITDPMLGQTLCSPAGQVKRPIGDEKRCYLPHKSHCLRAPEAPGLLLASASHRLDPV